MEKEKVLVLLATVLAGIGCVFSTGMLIASALNLFEVSSDLQVGFLATAIACFSTALTAVLANMRLQESYALSEEVMVLIRDVADLTRMVYRPPERQPTPVYQPEETYVDESYEPEQPPVERRRISVAPPEKVFQRHARPEELPPVRVKKRPAPVIDEYEVDYNIADRFRDRETQQPIRKNRQEQPEPVRRLLPKPQKPMYRTEQDYQQQSEQPKYFAEGNGENVPVRPDRLPKILQRPVPEVQSDRLPVDSEQKRRDQQTQRRMMSPFDTRREQ